MSWYRVIAVDEDKQPFADIDIEAIDLTDMSISAVETTNHAGEVLFTGLAGPQFFRPVVQRTSVTVGGRVYTGKVEIQIVGMSTGGSCYDAVVDCDGGGTHTTIEAAITSALAASGSHYTILVCCDVTMAAAADIGGIDKTILIVGLSPSGKQNAVSSTGANRWSGPTISAAANTDMFKQTAGKDGNDRGLILANIGLVGQDGKALFLVATGGEIDFIEFTNCYFGLESSGGAYLVSNGLSGGTPLGALNIGVYDCGGTIGGFYENNSTPPDQLVALYNRLTMTRWWTDGQGGLNQGNAADFSLVQGGFYIITNPMTVGAQDNGARWEFSQFVLQTGCSGAAFRHHSADTNHSGVSYRQITLIATANDTNFGDFQGPSANPQANLYIADIHGVVVSGVSPTGTFLTVDSDQQDPYVADIHAPDWPTVYSGPPTPHIESIFVVAKSGAYTLTSGDGLVVADASGGAFTVTLPTAVGITGTVYRVKKIDATANAVTIDGAGAETIDGGATATISTQYEAITVISDGTEWWVL